MSSNWQKVKLGEVCKIRRGSSPRPIVEFMADSGMPWVKISDATETDSRFIEKTKEFIKHEGVAKSVIVNEGDLILSNSGTAGLPKFMNITACIHDGWQTLSDFDGVNKYFLYYSLLNIRSNLIRNAHDSTMKNLTLDMVRDAEICLPSLIEQEAISKVLSDIDSKIELNNATNRNLEQIAQAIFKSWFVDFDPVKTKIEILSAGGSADDAELAAMSVISAQTLDELNSLKANNPEAFNKLAQTAALFPAAMQESELGEIPEGWSYCTFGDISACFDSKRVPLSKRKREEKQPGTIPYYGATSVMDYVNEWIFDDTYLLLGEDGSVVKDDGTPFVQYIWGKSWVNNHAHVLQGNNGVSTEHLMVFIKGTNIASYVTGAVQLKLNQKNMNSIPFLKAGTEINLVFQRVLNGLYDSYKNNIESSQSLSSLRDSLLPRLLSGEMELKDKE